MLKITQPTAVVKRNFIAHLLKDVACVKISLFYSKIKSWENIQRLHKNIMSVVKVASLSHGPLLSTRRT